MYEMELPKTIEAWLALTELPLPGRYLVLNVGILEARVSECRAAGVQGLPRQRADENQLFVRLPNITVGYAAAGTTLHRLPVDFGPVARAIFEEAGRRYLTGERLLPHHYTLGVRPDGDFAFPDGETNLVTLERN